MNSLKEIVKANFLLLKDTHIYNAAGSSFPSCSINEFKAFATRCSFVDSNVPSSTLDRLFIQANVELVDQKENPDRSLIRFEFIELLIRIANDKYFRH